MFRRALSRAVGLRFGLKAAAGLAVIGSGVFYLQHHTPPLTPNEVLRRDFLNRITQCEVDNPEQTQRINEFLRRTTLSMGVIVKTADVNLQTVISSANSLCKSGRTSGTAHVALPDTNVWPYDYVIKTLGLEEIRENSTWPLSALLQNNIGLTDARKPLLIIISNTDSFVKSASKRNIMGIFCLAMDAHSYGLRHKFIVVCDSESVAQTIVDLNQGEKIHRI